MIILQTLCVAEEGPGSLSLSSERETRSSKSCPVSSALSVGAEVREECVIIPNCTMVDHKREFGEYRGLGYLKPAD